MNRHILITGISTGIGNSIARYLLAKDNHNVVIGVGRHNDESLNKFSNYHFYHADLSDTDRLVLTIDTIIKQHDSIEVLINNAGSGTRAVFEDMPIAQARSEFELNFWSPLIIVKSVLPSMKLNKSGLIININSLGSFFSSPTLGYYSAAKNALNSMTLLLKMEMKKSRIRFCSVFPGAVKTNFGKNIKEVVTSDEYESVYKSWNERFRYFFKSSISSEVAAKKICSLIEHPKSKLFLTTRDWLISLFSRVLPEKLFLIILIGIFYKDEG